MFWEESLGKIKFRAFPKQVGAPILSLESVDYFGTSKYFSGREKTKNSKKQKFDAEANWSGVCKTRP